MKKVCVPWIPKDGSILFFKLRVYMYRSSIHITQIDHELKSAIEFFFRSKLPPISINSGLTQGMWVFWAGK
jgi:hypothetical protein